MHCWGTQVCSRIGGGFFTFFPVYRSASKERMNIRPNLMNILRPLSPHLPRKNILRPLSPHLPIYKPQLTSTFPIYHRISGAFLATLVLFFYLLCDPFGVWDSFLSVGSQVSLRLGGRALSFFLIKMGCSGGLFSRPLEVEGRAQV